MSEASNNPLAEGQEETVITADQVSAYLLKHTDFFEQHAELLTRLAIPHEVILQSDKSGQTVSLIERQVATLRDENHQLKQQLSTLIDNARVNDQLFDKARQLMLALIPVTDLSKVGIIVEQAMQEDFNCDLCQLWLVSPENDNSSNTVLTQEEVQQNLQRLVAVNQPYCGVLKTEESQRLFGDQAELVGSAAILPLYDGKSLLAILAIASKDEGYYRNSMSTSLLAYISEIVAQIIHRLQAD